MLAVIAAALMGVASAPPSALDSGIAARQRGEPATAVDWLAIAVMEEPDNADAWVQFGFALRDTGHPDDARGAFERALALAPDYADARDGLASLAPSAGEMPQGRAPDPVVVTLDGSWSALEDAKDWDELRLGIAVPTSGGVTVGASLETGHRFGVADSYGELRLDSPRSRVANYYAIVGGTPDADFRPRWQIGAGGSVRVADGTVPLYATLDVRHGDYPAGAVTTLAPGTTVYASKGRVWASARWINVFADGRHSSGGLARVDVETGEHARLFAGFARAPDLAEGRVVVTTSLFGGANVRLSDRVDWRVSLARDEPTNGLDRTTLSTGLSLRL